MITVLVANDHVLLRDAIRTILEQDESVKIVGEANDTAQVVQLVLERRPDVVVLDAGIPSDGGAEATRQIKDASPSTAVLVLGSNESASEVFSALKAGARGYLLRTSRAEQLGQAVRCASVGGFALHSEIAEILLDCFDRLSQTGTCEPLVTPSNISARELEVVRLVARGSSNQQIARQFSLSLRTVQAHVSNVFVKTGTRSRLQLTLYALRNRWIRLDDTWKNFNPAAEDRDGN